MTITRFGIAYSSTLEILRSGLSTGALNILERISKIPKPAKPAAITIKTLLKVI